MWDPLGVTSPAVLVPADRVLGSFLLLPAHNPWRWQVGPKNHPEAVVTCCPSKARVLPHASCTLGLDSQEAIPCISSKRSLPTPHLCAGPTVVQCMLGTTLSHNPPLGAVTEATGLGFPDSQGLHSAGLWIGEPFPGFPPREQDAPRCLDSTVGQVRKEALAPALSTGPHFSILLPG